MIIIELNSLSPLSLSLSLFSSRKITDLSLGPPSLKNHTLSYPGVKYALCTLADGTLSLLPIHSAIVSSSHRPIALPDPSRVMSSGSSDSLGDGEEGLLRQVGGMDSGPLMSENEKVKLIPRPKLGKVFFFFFLLLIIECLILFDLRSNTKKKTFFQH